MRRNSLLKSFGIMICGFVCGGLLFASIGDSFAVDNPVSIHSVQSQGTYVWEDGSQIHIYGSDLENLHNSLNSLDIYAGTKFGTYSTALTTADTSETNGKQVVVNKIKSYVSTSATGSTAYSTIAGLIDTVYNTGYSAGEAAAKSEVLNNASSAFYAYIDNNGSIAANDSMTKTNPYGKECVVYAACGGAPDSGYANVAGAYVYVNGVLKAGGRGSTSASWSGTVPAGASVKVATDGSAGTGHGHSWERIIFVR